MRDCRGPALTARSEWYSFRSVSPQNPRYVQKWFRCSHFWDSSETYIFCGIRNSNVASRSAAASLPGSPAARPAPAAVYGRTPGVSTPTPGWWGWTAAAAAARAAAVARGAGPEWLDGHAAAPSLARPALPGPHPRAPNQCQLPADRNFCSVALAWDSRYPTVLRKSLRPSLFAAHVVCRTSATQLLPHPRPSSPRHPPKCKTFALARVVRGRARGSVAFRWRAGTTHTRALERRTPRHASSVPCQSCRGFGGATATNVHLPWFIVARLRPQIVEWVGADRVMPC